MSNALLPDYIKICFGKLRPPGTVSSPDF